MYKAIGMVELTSIARGIVVADQMLKSSDVSVVTSVAVCPGKYIVIVSGEASAVEHAVQVGIKEADAFLIDEFVIPNVHPDIFPALVLATPPDEKGALGIIETFSLACMIFAADKALKSANIQALELRIGNGLGGRSYFTFTGDVAAVTASAEAGKAEAIQRGLLINAEVIPSPSSQAWESLY